MLEQRIDEVTKANQAFYEAFGELDIAKMDRIWAHQEYVTCIHPGWARKPRPDLKACRLKLPWRRPSAGVSLPVCASSLYPAGVSRTGNLV